jgi:fatty acid amide hydrolase
MRGAANVLNGQEAVRAQAGPMARTVSDLALVFEALDPHRMAHADPRVPPVPWDVPSREDVGKLRVGVYTDDGVLAPSHAVIRAVERAAEVLRGRGCEVVPFVPSSVTDILYAYLGVMSADGGARVAAAIAGDEDPVMKPLLRLGRTPAPARRALAAALGAAGEERTAGMLRAIGGRSSSDYWDLTSRLRAARFALMDAMESARIDVIVCPPYATPALPHGLSKNFSLASSYSILWNVMQLPGGVVPVTRVRPAEARREAGTAKGADRLEKQAAKVDAASAGLPVGVQVVARPWQDARVLAVMAAIEQEVVRDEDFPRTPVKSVGP